MRVVAVLALSFAAGCGGGGETDEAVPTIEERLEEVYDVDTGVDLRNDCFDAEVMADSLAERGAADVLAEFEATTWRVLPSTVVDEVATDIGPKLDELLAACSSVTGI
jgi:hypothetical protein